MQSLAVRLWSWLHGRWLRSFDVLSHGQQLIVSFSVILHSVGCLSLLTGEIDLNLPQTSTLLVLTCSSLCAKRWQMLLNHVLFLFSSVASILSQQVTANSSQHQDMLAALHGGSSALGVVTSVTFQPYDVSNYNGGVIMLMMTTASTPGTIAVSLVWQHWNQRLRF